MRATVAAAVAVLPLVFSSASDRVAGVPQHEAQTVRAGALCFRAVRSGAGPTVVLLHGYGESLLSWQGVFDELARSADVIAVDLPGFGLSSKPLTGYATDSLAVALIRLLDVLRVERATLVGHSLGGGIAVATAAMAPERVRGLVLLDPAVAANPWPLPVAADTTTAGRSLRDGIAMYAALRTRLTSVHDPVWLAESERALAYDPAADPAYAAALSAVLREFSFAYLTPAVVARLSMPTLVLWGEFDPVIPLETGRALTARLPSARFHVVSRSWHRPHVERPEEVTAAIERFVADLQRRSPRASP